MGYYGGWCALCGTFACFALIRRWRDTFPTQGEGFFGDSVASCDTSQQWRSRLLAPRLGRGSLCGNDWWVSVNIGWWCRFAQDDTWGAGAWDGKQNAVSVRKVKCRICQENKMPYLPERQNTISFSLTELYPQPNKFRTTPLSPSVSS